MIVLSRYFHFRSNRVKLVTTTRRVGNNFGAGNIIILHTSTPSMATASCSERNDIELRLRYDY